MPTVSLNPIWVNQNMMIPGLMIPIPSSLKKDPGDKPPHRRRKRDQEEHQGWSRKKAFAKRQKEAAMLQDIRNQWRVLHGLPIEELRKIVPRVVSSTTLHEQMERLASINRGQQLALQQKYAEYQQQIEIYNASAMQYLLSQIL